MKDNLVIIVDGSYYIYNVYYAFPNLRNSLGEPTWVIYGVVSILKNIFLKYKPISMIVVFDSCERTFRYDVFKDYKLNRKPMPTDLYIQIPSVYAILKAMGIFVVIVPGVEADDVIGTLSVLFTEKYGCHVYIFSGDKDMMQLVNANVNVINNRYKILFTIDEVKKKFGLSPNLIVDYLALLGDSSDNIPGIPGIGRVTATFLLREIGNLDVVYRSLDRIFFLKGLRGAKSIVYRLEKYQYLALLSYELACIKKDVFLNISCEDFFIRSVDINTLIFFFKRYEFKRWLKAVISGKWLNEI